METCWAQSQTWIGETDRLVIPGYLQESVVHGVILTDGSGQDVSLQRPGDLEQPKQVKGVFVQLHKFYLRWPELCRVCACDPGCSCKRYDALWAGFASSQGFSHPTRIAKTESLFQGSSGGGPPSWWSWASQQPNLTSRQATACLGPAKSVKLYDRAVIKGVKFGSQ